MRRHMKPITINPRSIKSRDQLMVAIIRGVTKAGTFRNIRKHNNKTACRGKNTMPAAVLAHTPRTNTVTDWERDNDLFRIYANVHDVEGTLDVSIKEIHLLDDALQTAAVVNDVMFTPQEWDDIQDAAKDEFRRNRGD